MRTFYSTYRSRRISTHSHSGCTIYPAAALYHAVRAFTWRETRCCFGMPLYCNGAFRAAGICRRRRSFLCAEAKFWLHHRIRSRLLCDRSYRQSSPQPGIQKTAHRQFRRSWNRLFFWHGLLLPDEQFLSWCADWLMAAVSVLLYFGCAGRYCPVHSWSGTRKKADSHHEKEQEVI